jgi:hypothetical protein
LSVRILTRNAQKAAEICNQKVEIAVGDIRELNTLPAAMSNISYIICYTGKTAFASARWEFDSPPNMIEWGLALFDPQSIENKAENTPYKLDY